MKILVVGAGFAGATAARVLADVDHDVLVVDKRCHVGGNAYEDTVHGMKVHPYGPHIFHTSSDRVSNFLSRFTEWRDYEHEVRVNVNGRMLPLPVNRITLGEMFGIPILNEDVAKDLIKTLTLGFQSPPRNSEDSVLMRMGPEIYEAIFKPYTIKQWDMSPAELGPEVCARIPIRYDLDCRYFTDSFQKMPKYGFRPMFETLLNHNQIEVSLSTTVRSGMPFLKEFDWVLWTGPIDEYFEYSLGALQYRSAKFDHVYHTTQPWSGHFRQDVAVYNYPQLGLPYTRVTEMKRLTGQTVNYGTVLTYETPQPYEPGKNEPYWPVPTKENKELRKHYFELARETAPNVVFFGRLGSGQYLDMHQACAQGMKVAVSVDAGINFTHRELS